MITGIKRLTVLFGAALTAGCVAGPVQSSRSIAEAPPTTVEAVGVVSANVPWPKGYLELSELPDSLKLLPAPPAKDSAAMGADQEAFTLALSATSDRNAIATSDADLSWPHLILSFESILGTSLSDGSKPNTEMLLRRSMVDAALSTYRAKDNYQRIRPFVENGVGTCTPQEEAMLRTDGSYPSGHTAIGWMLALVLVDLAPEKENEVLKRGYDFGQSRVVCRAHWLSDTTAGRVIASATYARLQSNPVYVAQRDLARAEMAAR